MRELVQADQRTTPHRSALDFLFSFGCAVACAWLGERSEPTCIKTSTRHGAKNKKIHTSLQKSLENYV